MTRSLTHRLVATLFASGLLLSACGQSDASGRVRNSSLGEGCFATQEEKDREIRYYQDFLDLSTNTKNEFETIDKAVKELQVLLTDLYNKTTDALTESMANPSPENSAKVVAADTEWNTKQKELNDLFPKLSDAKRNIREYPQFETALQDVQNKPVCESTPVNSPAPQIADGPTEPTVDTTNIDNQITNDTTKASPDTTTKSTPDIINNIIPNNVISTSNIEECQQPLEVTGGVNQVIRTGESLEFLFPLCSTDSYVTLWGDFETGLSVYTNDVIIKNKPHLVFRLSSTQPLSGTYFFQQIDRISKTQSPKSQLDLTVIETEETRPCAGKTPYVEMSADGVLTAASTCEETDYIEIQVTNIETSHLVVDVITLQTTGEYKLGNMYNLFGTEVHEVTAYHVKWDKNAEPRYGGRLGDILSFQFQLKPPRTPSAPTNDIIEKIDLPPFFDVETNSETTSASDNAKEVETAKILISPTTLGMTCNDVCTNNVIQQSGMTPDNVEKIEASVNGSDWITVQSTTTLPLIDVSNKVSIRVTPKDGSKPVVLTNTLYRDTEAMSGANVAETIALGVGGEQTITAIPKSSGISPAQLILIAVVAVFLLLLAMLFMRARRKA